MRRCLFSGPCLLPLLLLAVWTAGVRVGGCQGFGGPIAVPVSALPTMLATADLDGDGRADVMYLDGTGTVHALTRGAGDGFRETATVAIAGGQFAVADADRDGRPDLVWVELSAGEARFFLARGLGDGTFAAARVLASVAMAGAKAPRLGWLTVAGLHRTGYLDLLVEDVANGVLWTVRADGSGVLPAVERTDLPGGAGPMAVGDVDGDGLGDVVVGGALAVAVLRSDGAGGLVAVGSVEVSGAIGVALTDVDGDGVADLLVLSAGVGAGSRVTRFSGLGHGRFGAGVVWESARRYGAMLPVTLAGESVPSLVLADATGVWLAGDQGGRFSTERSLFSGGAVSGVAVAGEGVVPDLVVAARGGVAGVGGLVLLPGKAAARAKAADDAAPAATTVVLTGTMPVITYGQSFGGVATVSAATVDAPVGTVSFLDNGESVCTASAAPESCAAVAGYVFGAGSHAISAAYSGDATHAASASAPVMLTVLKNAVTATLRSSSGSVVQGQAVTLTATLTGSFAVPTGVVGFVDAGSGVVLGTAVLGAGGVGTVTLAGMEAGSYNVAAVYGETAGFLGVTSAPVAVAVVAPVVAPAFALAAGAVTMPEGGSGSVTVAVTPLAGWSGTVLLGCAGLPTGASCSFAQNTVATGATTTLTVKAMAFQQCGGDAAVAAGGRGWVGLLMGLAALLLVGGRRRVGAWAAVLVLAVVAGGVTGCGQTCTPGGTAAGVYAVQLTGRPEGLSGATSTVVVSQRVLVTVTR